MRPIINHIGVSGGKDSCALALWSRFESGYPLESIKITASDTYNEAEETYATIRRLEKRIAPLKIEWLDSAAFMEAKGLPPIRGFYELAKWKKRFPSARRRFCTQFLKIYPAQYYIKCLIALLGCKVVMHSGVRANESSERAKLVQREEVNDDITEFRPLLNWTLEDVWAIHKRYDFAPNPLYSMGASRVGCLPCVMSRKSEIANIAKRWPERIEEIRNTEQTIPGTHSFFPRTTVPLRFRSILYANKKGEKMMVASIDDVVRWATEKKMITPDMFEELDTKQEDATACQSTWGSCE